MKVKFILCSILLSLLFSNILTAQTWPIVIKNTYFVDYYPSLIIRALPDVASTARTSIACTSDNLIGRLVATDITSGGMATSPINFQTTNFWYKVDLPGTGMAPPPQGYCAAGAVFTNPECSAPYIQVTTSAIFIRTDHSISGSNVTIASLPAKVFLNQYYAVAGTYYDGSILWYKIDLPKGDLPKPEDCSQAQGWISSGSSSGSGAYVNYYISGNNALPSPTSLINSTPNTTGAPMSWSIDYYPSKAGFSFHDCSSNIPLGNSPDVDISTSATTFTPTTFTLSSLPNCSNCTHNKCFYVSTAAVCVSGYSNNDDFTLAIPSAVTASGAGTYCNSATITASGGSGETIYFQGTASGGTSTAISSTIQTVTSSGTYYFRARSLAGCWGPEGSVTVTINTGPTVLISGSGTYCGNTTITATSSGSGTIYYQGTSPGMSTSTPSTSQVITSSGTYYFSALSTAGCWGPAASTTVVINTPPATITGPSNACQGSAISLNDATSGGTWSSGNTAVGTINSFGIFGGISPGTTIVTYSVSGCTATKEISVNPIPAPITGSTEFCNLTSTTYASATSGGVWSSSNTSVITISPSAGIATGSSEGSSNIIYTFPSGCSMSKTVGIIFAPYPIHGDSLLCQSQISALYDTITGGTWSSNNAAIVSVSSLTGVETGGISGTAIITYTLSTLGCLSTYAVTVSPTPNVMGTANVCLGQTTNLSGSPSGGTWSSNNTLITTVGNTTGIVTGISVGNTAITYSVPAGCLNTLIVTVNPQPETITGNINVCVGFTTMFSNAVTGGTWSSSNLSVATAGSSTGTVTGISPGTATITYTLGAGCFKTAVVTVSPAPLTISGSSNVCEGLMTTLAEATTGGVWSSSNTAVASVGSATGIVTGISAGTTAISYLLPSNCFATIILTVNPQPTAITGTTIICVNSATTLGNTIPGGTWSSSNANITIVPETGVATGIAAGTAVITYLTGPGCFTTAILTINPLPSTIAGNAHVCEGQTANLSDMSPGGTWSSSNISIATVGSSTGIVSGNAHGNTIISYTLPTGCFTTIAVTVNQLPVAISGNTSICMGAAITLSDAVTGGTWSSSNPIVAVASPFTGIVTGLTAGTANITYSVGAACFATTIITVNPTPSPISGYTDICEGTITNLHNAVTGGTWSSSNNSIAIVDANSGLVTAISPGTASIKYTLVTGCLAAVTEHVFGFPVAGFIIGPSSICVGVTITLHDTANGGIWYAGNAHASVIAGGIVTGVSGGTGVISYIVTNVCGTADTSINITINPLPDAGMILGPSGVCRGAGITLTESAAGGVWSMSNACTTVSGGVVTTITAGKDTCMYTVSNTCGVVAATKIIIIDSLPDAGIIIGLGNVCVGSITTLTDAAAGGIWTSSNGNAIAVDGAITGITTGNDTVYYIVSNACGNDTANRNIDIYPSLFAGILSGQSILCEGAFDTLVGAIGTGTWNCSNSNASVTNGVIFAISKGIDTVSYTVANPGCSDFATFVLTINSLPDAGIITGAKDMCIGAIDTLSATILGGLWSCTNTKASMTDNLMTAHIPGSDTITYSVTNSCGIAHATKAVNIIDSPDASIIYGLNDLCVGSSILLTDSNVNGIWTCSNNRVAVVDGTVTGITAGTSKIFYTVTNHCGFDFAQHTIAIHPIPNYPIITKNGNKLYVPPIYAHYQWTFNEVV